eukprot:Colp12_sorted_trinity150504_noHs@12633
MSKPMAAILEDAPSWQVKAVQEANPQAHVHFTAETEVAIELQERRNAENNETRVKIEKGMVITLDSVSYSIPVIENAGLVNKIRGKYELKNKYLLTDVTGALKPGTMTALMGPSGAGKSTLLDVIAGRKNVGVIEGNLLFNGRPRPRGFKRMCGYVEQRDILISTLTVRELLQYTAQLRLHSSVPYEKMVERANEVIDELGLTGCADTIIGGVGNRGVSGGQAKRVNIAIELITNPSLLFLDEPTSGLDSATSLDVMKLVREICDRGTTVICTIHQPSTDVYYLFDRLLLLVAGRTVYLGPIEGSADYFRNFGFKQPPSMSDPDFIVEVTAVHDNKAIEGPEVSDTYFAEQYKKSALAELRKVSTMQARDSTAQEEQGPEEQSFINSIGYNLKVLMSRNISQSRRNPDFLRHRLLQYFFIALVFLSVFHTASYDMQGIRIRQSLMMLSVIFFVMGANSFIGGIFEQRLFVTRERLAGTYQMSAYYIAEILFEVSFTIGRALLWAAILYWGVDFNREFGRFVYFCIIVFILADLGLAMAQTWSAVFSTFEVANAMASTLPFTFVIFSGFFIPRDSIPDPWIWMFYLSFCNYAITGLVINEFEGNMGYTCPNQGFPNNICPPTYIIKELGAPISGFLSNKWANLLILCIVWAGFRITAYLCMRFINHIKR